MLRVRMVALWVVCQSVAVLVEACHGSVRQSQQKSLPISPGVSRAYMDTTCAPCRDFYEYANGGWLETATIPPDYPAWGVTDEMDEHMRATLHEVLDSLRTARAAPGSNEWKLGTFYATCVDSVRAEREGAAPLREELQRIAAISSSGDVRSEVAQLHRMRVDALFAFTSLQNFKNATQVIADARQGGLGLPERDYYLRADSASERLRREYVAHVARTLELLGEAPDSAQRDAGKVMAIETALARTSMDVVTLRNPDSLYHTMRLAELQRLTPGFRWAEYAREVGRPDVDTINVEQPAFFSAVSGMLERVPVADWRAYLRWRYADAASPWLSAAFVSENFRFRSLISGERALQPRWKRCLRQTDRSMGEALGREYVKRAFSPRAKARALALVRNLEAALRSDLDTLPWMGDSTRRQAIAKLDTFMNKIGYPDRWRDYSALEVRNGPFVLNVFRANQFETARRLAKIGKPVDRGEWEMSPSTNNAYYNPFLNEIVFPAGILQPPFFDPDADDAANYGATGATIGHEMTHGFDDEGRKFDAQGNLRDWWTAGDAKRFTERATLVVDQFDQYVAVDALHVNGKLTLGENIADLGGLKIAYAALQRATAGKPRRVMDGLTPEQRFFVAYAQSWRSVWRPELLRLITLTNPHAPDKWRVNGPISNMPEFARAFGCKPGDPMVRPDSLRAQIW